MKIIHLICAARPNFMKIAPLYHVLKKEGWCVPKIVHTGQHYDPNMSQTFFESFKLPAPDYYLGVGSGSHAEQTAQTMIAYEKLCLTESKPDLVIVVGDVNATLSCSIVAKKLHLKVAHLEAGLRSYDRDMPEEINRIVTDAISDYYWTPSADADANLLHEGIKSEKISLVGNIMIDTYCMMQDQIKAKNLHQTLGLQPKQYITMTLHRPVNVDTVEALQAILAKIAQLQLPVVLPLHPRTKKTMEQIKELPDNLKIVDPLGYVDFMSLVVNSKYVISDSGGVQEETTYLGIPCFTLRDTTERPVTVTIGSNQLVTVDDLLAKVQQPKNGAVPPLWDGKTANRLVNIIKELV